MTDVISMPSHPSVNVPVIRRLKLFLEEFGVKSVVLNSELPVATRCHTVQQFNKGLYEYLLATDEKESGSVSEPSKKAKL